MGENTKIEWTDFTFNPWWGCARVSPACRFCYADRDARRYGHELWRRKGPRRMLSDNNWKRPLKWNRDAERAGVPAKVFCASMADVFEDHPQVVDARKRLWGLIEQTPWLRWQLLTKRPENITSMVPWGSDWPNTVWIGTSVENQRFANERLPILVDLPAAVHFVSCEPLLGPVDLSRWFHPMLDSCTCAEPDVGGYSMHEPYCGDGPPLIEWLISGGESGPKARLTHPDWLRSLRDQCITAGVPHLLKQFGEYSPYIPTVADSSRPDGRAPDWDRKAVWVEATTGKTVKDEADVPETGSWQAMYRVGKKAAGRRLDGRTWTQFPQLAEVPA
jgi:protein gp37